MPNVPSVQVYTDTTLPASDLNDGLGDPVNFLLNKPVFRGRSNATQSISNNTYTSVNLQVEDIDDDPDGTGSHSTSSNTSRFTARYPGRYLVSATVLFAGNTTGRRGVRFAVNGTLYTASKVLLAATISSAVVVGCAATLVYLNEGDYVEAQALQESGGSLNIGSATVDDNSTLTAVWESN